MEDATWLWVGIFIVEAFLCALNAKYLGAGIVITLGCGFLLPNYSMAGVVFLMSLPCYIVCTFRE